MGRRLAALGVVALLAAACSDSAVPSSTTRDETVFAWEAHCFVFLDQTAALPISRPDYFRFGEVLADALRPLLGRVFGEDPLPIEDQALLLALERLSTGDGSPDDLWAIGELGGMLVAEGAATCADLGRNLSGMPARPPEDFGCESAPPEQRSLASAIPLTLSPQPVTAGAEAALTIGAAPDRPDDSAAGSGVQWACWNGREWVGTHMLALGWGAGGPVYPGKPGATTTYGGVAVWVPATFFITIPDVPPGWYRLRVDVMAEHGYLAVEVVAPG